jgi:hypothetical protein
MAGRTSFTKRQKEQARQQHQRDKAERKSQRKLEKPADPLDDPNELARLAQEQAALFRVGSDEAEDKHPADYDDRD